MYMLKIDLSPLIKDTIASLKPTIETSDLFIHPQVSDTGFSKTAHTTVATHMYAQHLEAVYKVIDVEPFDITIQTDKPHLLECTMSIDFQIVEYDALVFPVVSEKNILATLHDQINAITLHVDEYKQYTPHVTCCFLKKNTGHKYVSILESMQQPCIKTSVEKLILSEWLKFNSVKEIALVKKGCASK
jgi:hypothetical protein